MTQTQTQTQTQTWAWAWAWADTDGEHILINSVVGYQKLRNIERDPCVAVAISDPADPTRYIAVRGRVTAMTTEGAADQIEALAQKYLGGPYPWYGSGPVSRLASAADTSRLRSGRGPSPPPPRVGSGCAGRGVQGARPAEVAALAADCAHPAVTAAVVDMIGEQLRNCLGLPEEECRQYVERNCRFGFAHRGSAARCSGRFAHVVVSHIYWPPSQTCSA